MSNDDEKYLLGKSPIFTPEVINDIHVKAELGRYRMRGFSMFKIVPGWDELTFLPGTLTRFVIEGYREKCETKTIIGPRAKRPIELDIPVYITGMSFGALSGTAKEALGRGATIAGTSTTTGDGGMTDEERGHSKMLVYHYLPSRYGMNPDDLRRCDAIEVVVGQGAKPGGGGMLLGQKISCLLYTSPSPRDRG